MVGRTDNSLDLWGFLFSSFVETREVGDDDDDDDDEDHQDHDGEDHPES